MNRYKKQKIYSSDREAGNILIVIFIVLPIIVAILNYIKYGVII